MKFIRHIDLDTRREINLYREQVLPEKIGLAAVLIRKAMAEKSLIQTAEFEITIIRINKCFIATIWEEQDTLLCKVYLAGHSRCGAALWKAIDRNPDSYIGKCQPEPWCAIKWFTPDREPLQDFIYSLSWAWIDSITGGKNEKIKS